MLHKFSETSIYTKFLKSLVANNQLPLLEIWKPGRPIIKDFYYITDNYIVRAIQSWSKQNGDDLVYTDFNSETDPRFFKIISPFIRNTQIMNVTSNYISNALEYDADTHYYLGQYLKLIRDFDNINLMPYYNCIDGSIIEDIRLDYEYVNTGSDVKPVKIVKTEFPEDNYKVLKARIDFNRDYTIYTDSDLPIYIGAVLHDGYVLLDELSDGSIQIKDKCSKSKPFLYRVDQNIGRGFSSAYYSKYLTLLIQVPKTCNNVVVLDGDYTNNFIYVEDGINKITRTYFGGQVKNLSNNDIEKYCKVLPNLIRATSNDIYAYDDVLIEYLLDNVITSSDNVSKNIENIQKYISSYEFERNYGIRYNLPFTKGVWDSGMRTFIYDIVTNGNANLVKSRKAKKYLEPKVINSSGFVDKNAEYIIVRGQDV